MKELGYLIKVELPARNFYIQADYDEAGGVFYEIVENKNKAALFETKEDAESWIAYGLENRHSKDSLVNSNLIEELFDYLEKNRVTQTVLVRREYSDGNHADFYLNDQSLKRGFRPKEVV